MNVFEIFMEKVAMSINPHHVTLVVETLKSMTDLQIAFQSTEHGCWHGLQRQVSASSKLS